MLAMIRRLFNYLVNTRTLILGVFPTSADGVAATAVTLTAAGVAWTWGAWAQIVAAAGVTADQQLVGVTLENFVGAAAQGEVAIGTGGVGTEVEIARFAIVSDLTDLPAIFVPSGTRIAARYRTSTGAADTVAAKVLTVTGF